MGLGRGLIAGPWRYRASCSEPRCRDSAESATGAALATYAPQATYLTHATHLGLDVSPVRAPLIARHKQEKEAPLLVISRTLFCLSMDTYLKIDTGRFIDAANAPRSSVQIEL